MKISACQSTVPFLCIILVLAGLACPATAASGSNEYSPLWTYKQSTNFLDAAVDPSGTLFAGGSYDKVVFALNASGGVLWSSTLDSQVQCVAVSGSGASIVAGTSRGTLNLFDAAGNQIWSRPMVSQIRNVAIDGDGSSIAVASDDGYVYLISATGEQAWRYQIGNSVYGVAINPDGTRVAARAKGNKVYLLDGAGTRLWTYNTGGLAYDVAISPDSGYVACGCADSYVYLLDSAEGSLLWKSRTQGGVRCIDMTAYAQRVAAGTSEGYVWVLDEKGSRIQQISLPATINGVAITRWGGRLAAASNDGTFSVYIAPSINDQASLPPTAVPATTAIPPTTAVPTTSGEPGSLLVESQPAGAVVYLDEVQRGLSPMTITDVTPGEHTVRLVLAGYCDWTTGINVGSGGNVQINAVMTPATPPTRLSMAAFLPFAALAAALVLAALGRKR